MSTAAEVNGPGPKQIKNHQVRNLINLGYVALGLGVALL